MIMHAISHIHTLVYISCVQLSCNLLRNFLDETSLPAQSPLSSEMVVESIAWNSSDWLPCDAGHVAGALRGKCGKPASPVESDMSDFHFILILTPRILNDLNVLNPHSCITSSSLRASITWWNHYLVTKHLITGNLCGKRYCMVLPSAALHKQATRSISSPNLSKHGLFLPQSHSLANLHWTWNSSLICGWCQLGDHQIFDRGVSLRLLWLCCHPWHKECRQRDVGESPRWAAFPTAPQRNSLKRKSSWKSVLGGYSLQHL